MEVFGFLDWVERVCLSVGGWDVGVGLFCVLEVLGCVCCFCLIWLS